MKLHLSKLILALIPVLFITCSKSDDPKTPLYLLTKVTADPYYLTEYTYDGEKATGTSNTSGGIKVTGTFTYDGNGNIMDITYSDNAREIFTYTNDNITSRKKYDAANKLLTQWDYEYKGRQLTKVLFYEVASGTAYSAGFRVYEYDDTSADPARVKEFTKYTPTTPTTTYVYTYGQAKNAFAATPATALKKYLRLLSASTEKNVVEITDGTKTWNYTYVFNEQDYPIKRVEAPSAGQTYTINYDYTVIK